MGHSGWQIVWCHIKLQMCIDFSSVCWEQNPTGSVVPGLQSKRFLLILKDVSNLLIHLPVLLRSFWWHYCLLSNSSHSAFSMRYYNNEQSNSVSKSHWAERHQKPILNQLPQTTQYSSFSSNHSVTLLNSTPDMKHVAKVLPTPTVAPWRSSSDTAGSIDPPPPLFINHLIYNNYRVSHHIKENYFCNID